MANLWGINRKVITLAYLNSTELLKNRVEQITNFPFIENVYDVGNLYSIICCTGDEQTIAIYQEALNQLVIANVNKPLQQELLIKINELKSTISNLPVMDPKTEIGSYYSRIPIANKNAYSLNDSSVIEIDKYKQQAKWQQQYSDYTNVTEYQQAANDPLYTTKWGGQGMLGGNTVANVPIKVLPEVKAADPKIEVKMEKQYVGRKFKKGI